jgi:hypothetical protein
MKVDATITRRKLMHLSKVKIGSLFRHNNLIFIKLPTSKSPDGVYICPIVAFLGFMPTDGTIQLMDMQFHSSELRALKPETVVETGTIRVEWEDTISGLLLSRVPACGVFRKLDKLYIRDAHLEASAGSNLLICYLVGQLGGVYSRTPVWIDFNFLAPKRTTLYSPQSIVELGTIERNWQADDPK